MALCYYQTMQYTHLISAALVAASLAVGGATPILGCDVFLKGTCLSDHARSARGGLYSEHHSCVKDNLRQTVSPTRSQGGECAELPALHCLLTKTMNGTYNPFHGQGSARQGQEGGTLVIYNLAPLGNRRSYRETTPWWPRQPRRYNPITTIPLGNEVWVQTPQHPSRAGQD
jgi:hypothetical protein